VDKIYPKIKYKRIERIIYHNNHGNVFMSIKFHNNLYKNKQCTPVGNKKILPRKNHGQSAIYR